MRIREFHAEQWLPRPVEEVFTFFANAANLEALTPPWLVATLVIGKSAHQPRIIAGAIATTNSAALTSAAANKKEELIGCFIGFGSGF